jgi:hypothetical protein
MRFNNTVNMTEASIEKRIIARQPALPPRGRIFTFVASTGYRFSAYGSRLPDLASPRLIM